MKEKIFRIFSSNIKIRVSGRNINNFIKRIIKNNIKIVKLTPRSHKEVDLIIDYNDLEEIEKYKTIYDIKIVRYYGKLHIIKFLKKNRFILLFLLLGMIIVFILSNMIFSVEVIHSNSKIIKLVTEELKDRGIKKYAFAKSYSEVEKIEKEILNNNKDNLEWLEIIRNGTKYTVRVEERIIDDIKEGIAKTSGKYVEICDRKEAIAYAIHHGEPGDIIVLAGKGHEDYQEIKGKKYPMDERVLIAEILQEDKERADK